MFSLLFILYDLLVLPYLIAFEIESNAGINTFENIEDSFFIADILLNFHTAFYEEG